MILEFLHHTLLNIAVFLETFRYFIISLMINWSWGMDFSSTGFLLRSHWFIQTIFTMEQKTNNFQKWNQISVKLLLVGHGVSIWIFGCFNILCFINKITTLWGVRLVEVTYDHYLCLACMCTFILDVLH
jgi:hypothetical protein